MSQTSPIVCPRCRLNDQIQKVRAIVSAGTSTFHSSGIRPSAQASTDLSKRLAAPEKRNLPKPSSPALQYFSEPAPETGCAYVVMLLAGVSFVIGVVPVSIYDLVQQIGWFSYLISLGGAVVLFGIPFAVAWLWWANIMAKYAARENLFRARHAESNKQMEASHEQALARWQAATTEETRRYDAALSRWNVAYYCHRDDCVFLGSHFVPPERMSELLAYP